MVQSVYRQACSGWRADELPDVLSEFTEAGFDRIGHVAALVNMNGCAIQRPSRLIERQTRSAHRGLRILPAITDHYPELRIGSEHL